MMPSVKQKPCIQSLIFPPSTSVHPEQSDDINELFGEEIPVPIAPVVLTVEGEEARQAKDSVVPNA